MRQQENISRLVDDFIKQNNEAIALLENGFKDEVDKAAIRVLKIANYQLQQVKNLTPEHTKSQAKTRFKCSVCGKITSGRMPKDGDTSFRFPRRHKVGGKDCEGNILEAMWVTNTKL